MMYKVEISTQAETDLRGIFEYISYELGSVQNASKQLDRLEKCILSLNQMPQRYHLYEKEPWKSLGLRVVPVDNYCVFYIPNNEMSVVTIIRVMYGGRDIETQLDKYTIKK